MVADNTLLTSAFRAPAPWLSTSTTACETGVLGDGCCCATGALEMSAAAKVGRGSGAAPGELVGGVVGDGAVVRGEHVVLQLDDSDPHVQHQLWVHLVSRGGLSMRTTSHLSSHTPLWPLSPSVLSSHNSHNLQSLAVTQGHFQIH